ncbi:MAG: thioredoxin domain-containing protein [Armatimonadota bacterium]|nr:thioredoxin domain-containing protein [Armatimonadota bacterium]
MAKAWRIIIIVVLIALVTSVVIVKSRQSDKTAQTSVGTTIEKSTTAKSSKSEPTKPATVSQSPSVSVERKPQTVIPTEKTSKELPKPSVQPKPTSQAKPTEHQKPVAHPKPPSQSVPLKSSKPIVKQLPKLVDIGAEQCIPCKMMMSVLEELRKEYDGKLKVVYIDLQKNPEAAKKYGIQLIPTQIFYDEEGKEFFRHAGFYPKEEIVAKFKEHGINL